ncbi:winged helix-turn-helix transcriptional regulator [Frankia umida]|nr:winged helix-turn-helix transcriptional regulator [Frankia umida]
MSGTWTVVVLIAMCDDAQRHSDLLERIGGISRKTLTQSLRACVRARLADPGDNRHRPRSGPDHISSSQTTDRSVGQREVRCPS